MLPLLYSTFAGPTADFNHETQTFIEGSTAIDILQWILSGHLSSASFTANEGGTWNSTIKYTAFGEIRALDGVTATKYRYTGQLAQDVLGLDYYVARWYDPIIRHFVNADSIVSEPGKAFAGDRFVYANNNPIHYNDPSGNRSAGECEDGWCYGRNEEIKNYGYTISNPNNNSTISTPRTNEDENDDDNDINNDRDLTVSQRAIDNDISSIIELLIPSHLGGIVQIEVSVDLGLTFTGTIGLNDAYDFNSGKLATNVDWALEPGIGLGYSASATGGLLLG